MLCWILILFPPKNLFSVTGHSLAPAQVVERRPVPDIRPNCPQPLSAWIISHPARRPGENEVFSLKRVRFVMLNTRGLPALRASGAPQCETAGCRLFFPPALPETLTAAVDYAPPSQSTLPNFRIWAYTGVPTGMGVSQEVRRKSAAPPYRNIAPSPDRAGSRRHCGHGHAPCRRPDSASVWRPARAHHAPRRSGCKP